MTSRHPRRLLLPSGWPLYALFVGFPLWWALGMGSLIWPILAAPMFLSLLRARRVRVPRGFGIWLLFLAWMLVSATSLESADRIFAFLYRGSAYLSATVVFVYLYNSPPSRIPARHVVVTLSVFWAVVVAGGYLGTFVPHGSIATVAEKLIPAGAGDESLAAVLHPQFANGGEASRILGYAVGRPAAPFAYTNAWGSNFALLIPFVIMSWAHVRQRWWKLGTAGLMAASLVPLVSSLDRGAWLTLSLGLTYSALLFALRGRAGALLGVLVVMVVAVALATFTPMKRLIVDRLEHGHSDEGRMSLYREAVERAGERPLLGYGAPVRSQVDPTKPSVGTHGQLWLVLVGHGVPGMVLFLGWFALAFVRTRRGSIETGHWCHVVILIALTQLPFYEQLPSQIHVTMVAAALALRERAARPLPAPATPAPLTMQEPGAAVGVPADVVPAPVAEPRVPVAGSPASPAGGPPAAPLGTAPGGSFFATRHPPGGW